MAVTRVGKELISLRPELFAKKDSLITLAKRTQGRLGMNKIADFEAFSKVCLTDLFTLEWIPSRSDARVGYIKMRPTSSETITLMDELRAQPLMKRNKLHKDQAVRVYKTIKRDLVLKRPKVIDFIIANANLSDRPVDQDIFKVWVDDICMKQNRQLFSAEEKKVMFERFAAVRKALKNRPRPAPAPKPEEVNSVIENTPISEDVEDVIAVETCDKEQPDEQPTASQVEPAADVDVHPDAFEDIGESDEPDIEVDEIDDEVGEEGDDEPDETSAQQQ